MKITIDIDCTPQEVRTFLGLPDMEKMNTKLVESMQERIKKGFDPEELDKLIRAWMGATGSNISDMQKTFWNMLGGKGGAKKD